METTAETTAETTKNIKNPPDIKIAGVTGLEEIEMGAGRIQVEHFTIHIKHFGFI